MLIAQGTHVPMNDKDKRAKIGAGLAAMPLFLALRAVIASRN